MSSRHQREQIVDAGAEIILGTGVGSVTFSEVSDRLSCSKDRVRAQFAEPDDLVQAIFSERLGLTDLVDAMGARRPTVQALIDFGRSTLAFFDQALEHAPSTESPSGFSAAESASGSHAAAGDALASDPHVQRLQADRSLPAELMLVVSACYTHAYLKRFAPGAAGPLSDEDWTESLVLKTLPARIG